jgi:hypothetical protein
MTNAYPDVFTDAEIRQVASNIKGYGSPTLELDDLARQVRKWFTTCAEGNWLGLGIEIVTDETINIPTQTQTREQIKELLEERIAEDTEGGYGNWDDATATWARSWLDISPYALWVMINNARLSGLDEFNSQLLAMASGDDSGSTIGSVIAEAFADAVREWRDALQEAA